MWGTDISANQLDLIELNCEDLSMVSGGRGSGGRSWGGQNLVHVDLSLPPGAVVGVATGNGANVTANAGSNGFSLAFIVGSPTASHGGNC